MQEQKFCQSCGMPLSEEVAGTEANGSKNGEYCIYCYKDGGFTSDITMEQMIEQCVPHMVGPEMTEEKARGMMEEFFPTLKRWKQ